MKKYDVDMTSGSIVKHLVAFAIPMLLGNIFQQLYNMVDTWVVGNFVSNEAFSAVGTVSPIINMLIGFYMGLANGAGVVIAQNYGARKEEAVSKAVHTALAMTLVMGIAFTFIGILMTPAMLHLMKTPDEVFPESRKYLTIYFSGVLGLMIYNMGSGILQAVGDSRRPFIFLVVCAVMNTVLDLVFVIQFHLGVAGVAWATVIAELCSALLCVVTLMRTTSSIRLSLKKLRIDGIMLKKILSVGIPAALQMAVTAFSNVIVQAYINYFGADAMSGWTAYGKIDILALLPMQSLALASSTFVGQNLGAAKTARAKKGVRVALGLSMATTVTLLIPIFIFAPQMIAFFNSKPEVVDYGTQLIRWMSPFYVLCVFNQIYAGALRGAGNTKAPMVIMLTSFVAVRQIYLFIMSRVCNELIPIALGYPLGWFVCSLLTFLYYRHADLGKTRVVVD